MVRTRLKAMQFDGDIIITDPCYITKDRDTSGRPKWDDFMSRESYTDADLAAEGLTEEQIRELKEREFFPQYKKMREACDKWDREHPDDWEVCNYGSQMKKLGLKTCITNRTIYGDWGCTTFEKDTKNVLGKFCADAGMVGVFDLAEVLKYNPSFDYHINKPWTTTLLKDFKGEVYIEETRAKDDTYIRVIGEGINKVTGEPFCFFTEQTSL